MIGQFKLLRMTVIWPTSRKRKQGKKKGRYRLGNRPHTANLKVVRISRPYVYLLPSLSIQISKTKLLIKIASESGHFANLTEEDVKEIIDNKDSKQTKAVIEKARKERWNI